MLRIYARFAQGLTICAALAGGTLFGGVSGHITSLGYTEYYDPGDTLFCTGQATVNFDGGNHDIAIIQYTGRDHFDDVLWIGLGEQINGSGTGDYDLSYAFEKQVPNGPFPPVYVLHVVKLIARDSTEQFSTLLLDSETGNSNRN
ncbi:MAG: hypothetical protein ACK57V_01840 [Pirellula sp.]|jgi:hypothetical protein